MNSLTEAGWGPPFISDYQSKAVALGGGSDLLPARVGAYYGESCSLLFAASGGDGSPETESASREPREASAHLSGRLLGQSGTAGLTTGDWVVARRPAGADFLLVEEVLERRTSLARKAPGGGPTQLLAANVDLAFLVQGMDRDYNPRRLERYLAIVYGGGVRPVIVLNKCDLISAEELAERRAELAGVAGAATVVACSAETGEGLAELEALTGPGLTLCLLGSSGAGKSTLANRLLGVERQATGGLSELYGKGRHTTTVRELLVLPGRGVLIDTPGLREVALDASADLAAAFPEIEARAQACRFRDCAHEDEPGCAVRAAVESGELEAARLDSYFRLARELARLQTPTTEREARRKRRDERKAAKDQGKLYKRIQNQKRRERGR